MNTRITQIIADIAEVNPSVELRGLRDDTLVSFIPMSDVTDAGRWIGMQERRLDAVRVGYTPFAEGDILFAKITPCMENGKGAHARGLRNGVGFGSTEFHVLRARGQNNPRFLFHWLQAHPLRLRAIAYMGGSAGQQRVQSDFFTHFRISQIEPAEQSRIAAVLDTVDEAIEKTEAVIAKLKLVRAGLLHDLLTRGLDEHGQLRDPITHPERFKDSPMGRIPKAWAVWSLDSTVSQPRDLTIGPFGSNLLASDYRPEGAPVVFVRDVRENGFVWNSNIYVSQDKANELRAHRVFAGDVLVTKMGLPPCIAAVYPDTMPNGVITADLIRLRPRVNVATSFWLAAYINSPRFAACVRKITGGVTRPKVTLADFRKQPVLLPSVEEQQRIENIVRVMTCGIEEAEAESQKRLMLKSGLMADLLTGRVRVPDEIAVAP